jgi:hypothetical protein
VMKMNKSPHPKAFGLHSYLSLIYIKKKKEAVTE